MNITQKFANLVFPAPRSSSGERLPSGGGTSTNRMSFRRDTQSAFAGQQSQPERGTSPQPPDSRCQYTFSDGRQCRTHRAQFCTHHNSKQRESDAAGAPDAALGGLEGLCIDLTTATNINRALSHVFLLMAQGRISQKQAVAFGYLSQLLLQTVPGIRSEFVSAFGYLAWEDRLKNSFEPTETDDDDPDPSVGEDDNTEAEPQPTDKSLSDGVAEPDHESIAARGYSMAGKSTIRPGSASRPPAKVYPQDELSPRNKEELKRKLESNSNSDSDPDPGSGSDEAEQKSAAVDESKDPIGVGQAISAAPEPKKVNKARLSTQSLTEGLTAADCESIVARGRDLLAGKYSVTPEGRREAQALNVELELMNPPAAKPPKGARGAVLEHMKRWIAKKKAPNQSDGSFPPGIPPSVNFYGQPIPMAVSQEELEKQIAADRSSRVNKVNASSPENVPAANVYPPPRKGHLRRRNVHQKDELSPLHKVALFADDKGELRGVEKRDQELTMRPASSSRATSRSEGSLRDQPNFAAGGSAVERETASSVPTRVNSAPETPVPWYSELYVAPEPVTRLDWLPPRSKSRPPIAVTRAEKFVSTLRRMSNYRLRHLQHQNF
jgi:hypothetical protein